MNEAQNPYAPPSSLAELELQRDQLDVRLPVIPAGQGARLANFVIDYLARLAVGFFIGLLLAIGVGERANDFLTGVPGVIFGVAIFLAYYFVLEATTSRTIGKLVTGTKVVNEEGGTPTLGQIIGRTLCRLIPFEVFSFFGTPTRGWHDRIPRTYVVKAR